MENNLDVIIVAEAENLDIPYLLYRLDEAGKTFEQKAVLPKKVGLMLFASINLSVTTYKEETHFTAYKVQENGKNYLLFATHFSSAMFASESARSQRANDLCRVIQKLETICNIEAAKTGESTYNTVIVGDFNLQPFSDGIIGMHGFNAIMDAKRAKRGSRTLNGFPISFYYNPMWHLMGKRGGPLGTYYCESDQDDKSFYWYTFDQVLLKPDLIDDFIWDEFKIVDRIGDKNLINSHKIKSERFSDHLPIKFELR